MVMVIDAHSRRAIGWAIDEHICVDLVQGAARDLPENVVFHCERAGRLVEHGEPSMAIGMP